MQTLTYICALSVVKGALYKCLANKAYTYKICTLTTDTLNLVTYSFRFSAMHFCTNTPNSAVTMCLVTALLETFFHALMLVFAYIKDRFINSYCNLCSKILSLFN